MPHLLLPLRALVRSPVEPAELASAVAEMEQLDRMRVALASSLEGQSDAVRAAGARAGAGLQTAVITPSAGG